MTGHSDWDAAYSSLKAELVAKQARSGEPYQEGKTEFIKRVERLAAEWASGGQHGEQELPMTPHASP